MSLYGAYDNSYHQTHGGCKESTADPCLFMIDMESIITSYVLVYVDDIVIATKSVEDAAQIETMLRTSFDIGSMDDMHLFLGMLVTRNRASKRLWVTQRSYVSKMARRFNLVGSSSNIPMRNGVYLEKASSEIMTACVKPYRELVGSLMYIACCTRPDVMFATAYLARYVSCYCDGHWKEAQRVLKYLISTSNIGLCYGESNDGIMGYTDADWDGEKDTRKSTGGFAFTMDGACISWSSKRQRSFRIKRRS